MYIIPWLKERFRAARRKTPEELAANVSDGAGPSNVRGKGKGRGKGSSNRGRGRGGRGKRNDMFSDE